MFRTIFNIIKSLFCEHEFKVITIPIAWDWKRSDLHRKGVKSCMLKYYHKCDTTRPI